jgi:hypothetical protein
MSQNGKSTTNHCVDMLLGVPVQSPYPKYPVQAVYGQGVPYSHSGSMRYCLRSSQVNSWI